MTWRAPARRHWKELPEANYRDRIAAAIQGRFAGCVLGSVVVALKNWTRNRGI